MCTDEVSMVNQLKKYYDENKSPYKEDGGKGWEPGRVGEQGQSIHGRGLDQLVPAQDVPGRARLLFLVSIGENTSSDCCESK